MVDWIESARVVVVQTADSGAARHAASPTGSALWWFSARRNLMWHLARGRSELSRVGFCPMAGGGYNRLRGLPL